MQDVVDESGRVVRSRAALRAANAATAQLCVLMSQRALQLGEAEALGRPPPPFKATPATDAAAASAVLGNGGSAAVRARDARELVAAHLHLQGESTATSDREAPPAPAITSAGAQASTPPPPAACLPGRAAAESPHCARTRADVAGPLDSLPSHLLQALEEAVSSGGRGTPPPSCGASGALLLSPHGPLQPSQGAAQAPSSSTTGTPLHGLGLLSPPPRLTTGTQRPFTPAPTRSLLSPPPCNPLHAPAAAQGHASPAAPSPGRTWAHYALLLVDLRPPGFPAAAGYRPTSGAEEGGTLPFCSQSPVRSGSAGTARSTSTPPGERLDPRVAYHRVAVLQAFDGCATEAPNPRSIALAIAPETGYTVGAASPPMPTAAMAREFAALWSRRVQAAGSECLADCDRAPVATDPPSALAACSPPAASPALQSLIGRLRSALQLPELSGCSSACSGADVEAGASGLRALRSEVDSLSAAEAAVVTRFVCPQRLQLGRCEFSAAKAGELELKGLKQLAASLPSPASLSVVVSSAPAAAGSPENQPPQHSTHTSMAVVAAGLALHEGGGSPVRANLRSPMGANLRSPMGAPPSPVLLDFAASPMASRGTALVLPWLALPRWHPNIPRDVINPVAESAHSASGSTPAGPVPPLAGGASAASSPAPGAPSPGPQAATTLLSPPLLGRVGGGSPARPRPQATGRLVGSPAPQLFSPRRWVALPMQAASPPAALSNAGHAAADASARGTVGAAPPASASPVPPMVASEGSGAVVRLAF
jgi:hypothetical protein